MFDFEDLNFDMDGDGIADAYAENVDLDGDGYAESTLIDLDGDGLPDLNLIDMDGDGYYESAAMDSNGDGTVDTLAIELDSDGDGVYDTVQVINDYDEDGNYESIVAQQDTDGDGVVDKTTTMLDVDGDEIMEESTVMYDLDNDGVFDMATHEYLADTDGDMIFDTYVNQIDADGDGVFEAVEVYEYDAQTGEIELMQIDEVPMAEPNDAYTFDPAQAGEDGIFGDPEQSMEEWEFQGDTNRCALYSQKFVIEEITGEDINIEYMADEAEENGWFSEEGGTPILYMNKMLDEYGVENEMTFNNDIDELAQALENGDKVIVSVDSGEIWYGETDDMFAPVDGPDHAVQVIGIDNTDPENPMVILNDSGHPDGCGMMVPLDVFVDAWEDGDCQMITCYD